jgi:predicted RNase H-like nuclease (RuvC/YqgF family)
MAKTTNRPRPTAATPSAREVEKRLAALEKAVQALEKTVGDLKYELEQMRED